MTETVATVIVTYNRKHLLVQCLESVLSQTRKADQVILIDNASSDGTTAFLKEKGYLNNPALNYVRLSENTGGAGGFHEGMKRAFAAGFDWLWLMDDDGYPAPDCLEKLLEVKDELDAIGPAVVLPQNPSQLSWKLRVLDADGYFSPREYLSTHAEIVERSEGSIYRGQANFFNAILINRKVVEKVGLVLKELFIWGDEYEYFLRVKAANFRVGTQVESFYFHPDKLADFTEIKFYYLFRNIFYIYRQYNQIMYRPWLRAIFPVYIFFLYLKSTPSKSPQYLLQVLWSAFLATRGKLIPFN